MAEDRKIQRVGESGRLTVPTQKSSTAAVVAALIGARWHRVPLKMLRALPVHRNQRRRSTRDFRRPILIVIFFRVYGALRDSAVQKISPSSGINEAVARSYP